ncbi:uncharacterized protein LOC124816384 [Hydra vulgaris]|uniref:uncharacterized protein LOC124816384 n=1 Tax=Hydra vulgaris TaxID=6087 RepID=UPI0032EA2505
MEVINLLQNGINFNDRKIKVNLKCFACDSPARAFLKSIVSHSAYHSCERCVIKGSLSGRVVFNSNAIHDIRTNLKFSAIGYPDHQKASTPLIGCGVNCVTDFSLDYMCLVCLGVVKCIIKFFKSGPRHSKLPFGQISQMSKKTN